MKTTTFETPETNFTQFEKNRPSRVIVMQEIIDNVWINLKTRLNAIIREEGGHIEHF